MITSKFNTLFQHKLFRYTFIGGVSYVIELASIYFLHNILLFNPIISVGISFWAGLVISFILQKLVAFKNKGAHRHLLFRQVIMYVLLVGINYTFTLFFVGISAATIGLIVARTIALLITTGWNYIIYSRIIFKEKVIDLETK